MQSIGYAFPFRVKPSEHMQAEIDAEIKDKTAMLYKRAELDGRTIKQVTSQGCVVHPGLLEDGPEEPCYCGIVKSTYVD